jgi:hypothetical protein
MGEPFMGIQMGSHTVFDEDLERMLDTLQETAGINAVIPYATTYADVMRGRLPGALAPDHGVTPRDPRTRDTTRVWFEPHERYYADTFLRHDVARGRGEHGDRDVFATLAAPLKRRGIKLYARILEGSARELVHVIPNWPKILALDVYGRPTRLPCWNNPDYRKWWISTVEDLFKSYALDGFKYGAERSGPLSNLIMGTPHGVAVPVCFCEHCVAKGRAKGIDPERARAGFQGLHEFLTQRPAGARPVDGVLVTVLRWFLRYPEILAWETLWHESKEGLARQMYGAIKTITPEARVGWHVYHQGTTWDPIYRAATDYKVMAEYSDWIKPVVYHDIAGPRIRDWGVRGWKQRAFADLSEPQILELIYDVMGYDKKTEPGLEQLMTRGLSPDYVYRETKRCVDAVEGRVPVYAGLGFDIPWQQDNFPSDPDVIYRATIKAFEAGAKGLVVSREYDEMRLDNLRAVGRALKDARPS